DGRDQVTPAGVVDLDVLGGGRGDRLAEGAGGGLGAFGAVDLRDRRLTGRPGDDGGGRDDDDRAAAVLGRQRDEGGTDQGAVGPAVQHRQRRRGHDVGLVAGVVRAQLLLVAAGGARAHLPDPDGRQGDPGQG